MPGSRGAGEMGRAVPALLASPPQNLHSRALVPPTISFGQI